MYRILLGLLDNSMLSMCFTNDSHIKEARVVSRQLHIWSTKNWFSVHQVSLALSTSRGGWIRNVFNPPKKDLDHTRPLWKQCCTTRWLDLRAQQPAGWHRAKHPSTEKVYCVPAVSGRSNTNKACLKKRQSTPTLVTAKQGGNGKYSEQIKETWHWGLTNV